MNPNEASYTLIDYYVDNFKGAIENIFKRHGVNAPVTTDNVINASIAMKGTPLNSELAKAVSFEGFDGDTSENFGGKFLAFAIKAKAAVNKVKAKVKEVKEKASEKAEPEKEVEVKPKDKKIIGLNPYLFYGLLLIVVLTIIITAVKLAK